MRWALRLGGLLAGTAALRLLAAGGPLEARATLALGFVLLAAQLGAELAARAGLPRLTGALLAGVVLGPPWLELVRSDEVRALTFLADAALAFLALAAGMRLSLGALRRERATVGRLGAATILAPFAAVAAVALSVSPWLPLTRHQPFGDGLAVALVLGSVAVASAPAVVGALLDELERRGHMERRLVALSSAHALAALIFFALALVVAWPLASRGAVDTDVARATIVRLAGSLAFGGGLGVVVARVTEDRRRMWALVVVALVVAEATRVLGLEPALVALAGGCALGNATPSGDAAWRGALAPGATVAALAYFGLTGAGIDLAALAALWPWVVLFAGLRVVGLRAGARWASRSPAVTGDVARVGWLGVISQGGVALGLAGAARRAFPEWGVSLETLIVALVVVNLAAGPIVLRWVLAGSVQTTEDEDGMEHRGASDVAVAAGPRPGV